MSIFANLPADITHRIYITAVKLRDNDIYQEVRRSIFDLIGSLFKNDYNLDDIHVPGGDLEVTSSFYTKVCEAKIAVLCFNLGTAKYYVQYSIFDESDNDFQCDAVISCLKTDKYTGVVCVALKHYFPEKLIIKYS